IFLNMMVFFKYYIIAGCLIFNCTEQAKASINTNIFSGFSVLFSCNDTTDLTANDSLFNNLRLGKLGLGRVAYDYAMLGFNVLKAKGKLSNTDIISIADMSIPSSKKRLFVIDLKKRKLLFLTYVAHGKNSGLDKTLYFSNAPESNKSSLGFYTTLKTYQGSHGYSLRLAGQEIGFNNNAEERDIVVHAADYVTAGVVKSQGYLGRSLGCPALSPAIFKPIINSIKNGSCLFIYGNDGKYITNSKMLKQKPELKSDRD
ncbi:MAG: murein L,D-transpeptidase catalytic domain family protein, partial [Ginsengibacter sp.]